QQQQQDDDEEEEDDDEAHSSGTGSSATSSGNESDTEQPMFGQDPSAEMATMSLAAATKRAQSSAFKTTAMVLTDKDYGTMHDDDDDFDDGFVGLDSLKGKGLGLGKPIYNSYSIMSASARMRRDRKLMAHSGTERAESEPPSLFSGASNRSFLQQQKARMAAAYNRSHRDGSRRNTVTSDGYPAADNGGTILDDLFGKSKKKAKRSSMRRDYADRQTFLDGIYGMDFGMGSQTYDSQNYLENYLDVPRHSIIDPSMLSFDLPSTYGQGTSYSGKGNDRALSYDANVLGSSRPSVVTTGLKQTGSSGGSNNDGWNSGWSVAKPVGSSFLPTSTSLSAPGSADPTSANNHHAGGGGGGVSLSTFSPASLPADNDAPVRNYARLKTTADIAAAMDAAAAGDKNALRAIQATSMLSDLDDVPTEPADPRVEFSMSKLSSISTSTVASNAAGFTAPMITSAMSDPGTAATSPNAAVSPSSAMNSLPLQVTSTLDETIMSSMERPVSASPASASPSMSSTMHAVSTPKLPSVKLSRNVRERLMKARMKQEKKHRSEEASADKDAGNSKQAEPAAEN
ncbi:hypothetical protein LPJ56_003872, partial [Coemansia sp. RSA 2599]